MFLLHFDTAIYAHDLLSAVVFLCVWGVSDVSDLIVGFGDNLLLIVIIISFFTRGV